MPQTVDVAGVGLVEFPDEFNEEQIKTVLDQHFGAGQKALPETSALGAGLRGFARGVLPSMAAAAGSKVGAALGIESGPGLIATGIAGALGAGAAAEKLQEEAAPAIFPRYREYEQADIEQHPWATRAGEFASGLAGFRLSPLKGITSLPGFLRGTATPAQRRAALGLAANVGLGATVGAAGPLIQGRAPTKEDILTGAAMPLIYGEPRGRQILPRAVREAAINLRLKGAQDASRIREDAGQVPSGGPEPRGGEGQGRTDLEQPAPGKPGGAAPGAEAKAPEEGQQGILLESLPLDARPRAILSRLLTTEKPENLTATLADRLTSTLHSVGAVVSSFRNNHQIVDPIVAAIPIDVVDKLGGPQRTAQSIFNNPSMLVDNLSASELQNVGRTIESSAKSLIAGQGAKLPMVPVGSELSTALRTLGEAYRTIHESASRTKPGESTGVLSPQQKEALKPWNIRNQLLSELGRSPDVTEIDARRKQLEASFSQQTQRQTTLAPEDQSYLDAERKAISHDVDVGEENLPEGQPFSPTQVATINRQTGRVVVNPKAFSGWLQDLRQRGLNPEQIGGAIRATLGEEGIHLATTEDMASKYYNALSIPERAIEHKLYTGEWSRARAKAVHGREITDTDLGYEAIRRRIQRLNRTPSTEVAELIGRERWGRQGLEALNDVIRTVRETVSRTGTAEQRAMIESLQSKIDQGIIAAGGQPSKLRTGRSEEVDQYLDRLNHPTAPGGTREAWDAGLKAKTVEDLDALLAERRKFVEQGKAAMKSKNIDAAIQAQARSQFAREAIEAAIDAGSAQESDLARAFNTDKVLGERPLDWKKNPDVEAWARSNSAELNLKLPEPAAAPSALRRNPKNQFEADVQKETTEQLEKRLEALQFHIDQIKYGLRTTDVTREMEARWKKDWQMQQDFIREEIAHRQEQSFPSALRRGGKPETSEQGMMYLPPVPHGTDLQREAFAAPDMKRIGQMAESHFRESTLGERRLPIAAGPGQEPTMKVQAEVQAPSFERFLGELQSVYGSGITREKAYYAYIDAMHKRLMTATGEDLAKMIEGLGIKGQLEAEHQTSFGRGNIADALDIEHPRQQQFSELMKQFPNKKVGTPRAVRDFFGPQLRKRYAAIAGIAHKLSEEAGPPPEKPWTRPSIGPEDLSRVARVTKPSETITNPETGETQTTQPEVESKPVWYTLNQEQAKNPKTVGDMATSGAAMHAEGEKAPPRSVTKNVMAVRDNTGRISVVSTYRDGRRGPVATNPANPSGPAVKIDDAFLNRFRPFVVMQLRDPVKGFIMGFENQEGFDAYFGDVGIEGTEGIKTSSFAGPEAGLVREQAGLGRPTAKAAQAPMLPEAEEAVTARELEAPGPRAPIRAGRPLARYPQTFPVAPGPAKIPGMPAELPITPHTPMVPRLPYEEAAPTVSRPITEYGKPAQRQPGTEYRAGLLPEHSRRAPASLRRAAKTEIQATADDLKEMVQNWPLTDRAAYTADNVGNQVNIKAAQEGWRVRLASIVKPAGAWAQRMTPWQRGNPQVLSAANVLLQAGFDRSRINKPHVIEVEVPDAKGNLVTQKVTIPSFRDLVAQGRARAEQRAKSPDWRQQRLAAAELRAADLYDKELDYAEAHWDDPELQTTANRAALIYKNRLSELRKAGIKVADEMGFDPQRYDASLINPKSFLGRMMNREPKVLGTKTLDPRTYHTYYEAFANGPFLPATRDAASLVEHYMRRTGTMLAREQWTDALKAMRTPQGEPLAADAIQTPKGWRPHQAGYEVVNTGGGALSVHPDYAWRIRRLSDWRGIEDLPYLGAALRLSQAVKHSILIGDFFHLGRVGYYGTAIMGRKIGFQGGWSVLDIGERDMREAVKKGIIRQKDMDWANTPVRYGTGTITRRELAQKFYSEFGANLGRIQDALYKDLVTTLSPSAGAVRRGFVRITDPTVGRYNRFLFDKFTRGIMAEANVREFERQSKAKPNANPDALMRDIARDVNNFFGNVGRQGWFKSKTEQDLARLLFLAPQWVEGLIKKEAVAYSRLSGASSLVGARQGLTTLGTTGKSIGQGLLLMTAITQAINLMTRRQPTWKNEETGHKMDAWIPGWGADEDGFWLSPLAIFNEVTHDLYRLNSSKPTTADAISQIAGNKMQPITRAAIVAYFGQTPTGQKTTTTLGRYGTALSQIAPVPISFGRMGQAAGHALAPSLISPAPVGAVQRQVFATGGVKIEPRESDVAEAGKLAKRWMKEEGLEKSSGWVQVQTDEPSYTKLRNAIRTGDDKGAKKILEALRKGRTDREIMQAMQKWAKAGFTGNHKTERDFRRSLSDKEMEIYDRALERKHEQYEKWLDWYWRNS